MFFFFFKVNDLLMRNGDLLMQAAVLLIKNGFPIAMPIAVGTNWAEFTPADNPALVLALAGRTQSITSPSNLSPIRRCN